MLTAKVVSGFVLPVILALGAVAIFWNLTPIQQMEEIAGLGALKIDHYNLDGSYVDIGSPIAQFGNISPPWLWMVNRNPIEYFNGVMDSGLVVKYETAMNPLLIFLMMPAVAYSIWHYWKTRDRADLFGLVWWGWTYLSMYPLAFANRAMYIFYMLPVMGSISLMTANLFCHPSMNSYVRALYLICVIALMLVQFPVRPFA